jgi:PAS domain S-box-containing protein
VALSAHRVKIDTLAKGVVMITRASKQHYSNSRKNDQNSLRFEANRLLAHSPSAKASACSAEELLHELQVHQIELEMQNDELRRAQIIIEESRDRYLDLYDFAPIGYLSLGSDGMIAEMNLTCASLLGMERNKLVHHRFASLVETADRDLWYQYFIRAKQSGEKQSCELQLKRGDGSVFHARMDCGHMEVGSVSYMRIALIDITQQKRMEKQILERQKEVAELHTMHVAAQTAATIAHEINQPLLAIASYCDAADMLMGNENPDLQLIRKAIDGCKRQVHRAGHTMRELLELLKTKEFPVEAFDLNNEVQVVLSAAKAEHELEFDHVIQEDKGIPLVRANRAHFQKVMFNLLHNAIEAMRDAGVAPPTITVIVQTKQEEGIAQVTVQDNGPGIKDDDWQRLFDPFFTTKDGGMGMGLAVSRSLIEESGGRLWADPQDFDQLWLYQQERTGATFHLTLPLAS